MRFPVAVLPLQVSGQWFAVEALRIIEILGARPWQELAGTPRAVAGVIAWRGRAVSLIDPGRLIGEPWLQLGTAFPRLVVTQSGSNHLVLPAHMVREVQRIDELQPTDAVWKQLASGAADLLGVRMPLIDLAKLVEVIEQGQAESTDRPLDPLGRRARKTGRLIAIRRT